MSPAPDGQTAENGKRSNRTVLFTLLFYIGTWALTWGGKLSDLWYAVVTMVLMLTGVLSWRASQFIEALKIWKGTPMTGGQG